MKDLAQWKDAFRGKKGIWNLLAIGAAVVFVVLAILTFVGAGNDALVPFAKVLVVLSGVLMLAVAAEILLFLFVFGEDVPNFFCYDATRGKNIPVSALTPEWVGRRMDVYLGRIAKNKGQLWLPGHLEKCDFGADGAFRPVTAYKMLIDLAAIDSENGWRCFCAAAPATVKWIADALASCEPQMMKDVLYIKAKFPNDTGKIRDCLLRNRAYLQKRMMTYVVEHIQQFRGVR